MRIADAGRNKPGRMGDVCKAMIDYPDIASMGSHGPDITFFLDLMPVAQVWLQRGMKVYETIADFVEPFTSAIETVQKAVDEALAATVPGYGPLKAIFSQFGDTFDMIGGTLLTGLGAFASGYIDAFSYIKLPMQTGLREEGWFWFDMVHYRRTSQFASNLLKSAGNDREMQAYAAAYSTHLATDVTGHAYNVACSGGPYRIQWQRHHCTDNYTDVWVLGHYEGVDINTSNWHQHYPERMASKFRRQFLDAMKTTYTDIRHPDGRRLDGREWPNDGDLARMWEMLYLAMKMQTGGYSVERPSPPDFPIDFESFPSPPSFGDDMDGGRRRGGFSWKALFEALLRFVADTVKYVWDVVKWIVDTATATSLWPFQYALYLIQLATYQIYRACRRVLALRGYCFCHPDELVGGGDISSGWAGTLAGAMLVGASDLDYDAEKTFYIPTHRFDAHFPHKERLVNSPKLIQDAVQAVSDASPEVKIMIEACLAAGGFPQAFQTPWVYPTSPREEAWTINAPYPNGCLPDEFIEKASFHRPYYDAFKDVKSVGQMLSLSAQAGESSRKCLGNAVDLGVAMLEDISGGGRAPDFNLDGDRGYGWLCWDVQPLGSKDRKTDNFTVKDIVIGESVGKMAAKALTPIRRLDPKTILKRRFPVLKMP